MFDHGELAVVAGHDEVARCGHHLVRPGNGEHQVHRLVQADARRHADAGPVTHERRVQCHEAVGGGVSDAPQVRLQVGRRHGEDARQAARLNALGQRRRGGVTRLQAAVDEDQVMAVKTVQEKPAQLPVAQRRRQRAGDGEVALLDGRHVGVLPIFLARGGKPRLAKVRQRGLAQRRQPRRSTGQRRTQAVELRDITGLGVQDRIHECDGPVALLPVTPDAALASLVSSQP